MEIKTKIQNKIFRDTTRILEKYAIPYWLDHFTLLEIMVQKNNRQLPTRKNIYISISGDSLEKLLSIKNELGPLYKFYCYPDNSGRQWIPGNVSRVEIFNSWKRRSDAEKLFITPKFKNQDKYRWVKNRNCKWINEHYFNELDSISVNLNQYPTPSNPEDYLTQRYGNWLEFSPGWIEQIEDITIVNDPIIKEIPPKKVIKATPTIKIKLHEKKYHQRMKNMLLYTIDILKENNIPHWLEAGTLLGIVRDGDLIPWDYDADLGIPEEYAQKVLNLWGKFFPKYLVKKKPINSPWLPGDTRVVKIKTPWEKLKQINFHIDLFCLYHVGKFHRWIDTNALKQVDEKFHSNLETIIWEGREIHTPSHVDEYLTLRYGDWRTPKKDYDAGLHDCSIAEKGF